MGQIHCRKVAHFPQVIGNTLVFVVWCQRVLRVLATLRKIPERGLATLDMAVVCPSIASDNFPEGIDQYLEDLADGVG